MVKRLIGKNTAIFSFTSFLVDFSSEMIFPLLPLFLVSVLGATEFEIGIIEGVAVGTIGLFSLLSIYFINKLGNEKKAIIFGYSISSIMKIGFAVATSWTHVLFFRFLERLGKGVRIVARDTLIVLSENREKWGLAFGIRQGADTLGKILGPLLAGILLFIMKDSISIEEAYRNIFLIATVIALFSIPLLFLIKQKGKPKKVPLSKMKEYIFSKKHRGILALIGIVFFANFSAVFFILRSAEFLPYYLVPMAYIGYSALFALFSVPAGILTDRFGTKRVLSFALILYLISLILFGYFPSVFNIFLGFVLLGMFGAMLEISAKMFAMKKADGERYEIIFGAYQAVAKFIKMPSNLIAGFLWLIPLFGAPSTFAFGIIVALTALTVLMSKIIGKKDC